MSLSPQTPTAKPLQGGGRGCGPSPTGSGAQRGPHARTGEDGDLRGCLGDPRAHSLSQRPQWTKARPARTHGAPRCPAPPPQMPAGCAIACRAEASPAAGGRLSVPHPHPVGQTCSGFAFPPLSPHPPGGFKLVSLPFNSAHPSAPHPRGQGRCEVSVPEIRAGSWVKPLRRPGQDGASWGKGPPAGPARNSTERPDAAAAGAGPRTSPGRPLGPQTVPQSPVGPPWRPNQAVPHWQRPPSRHTRGTVSHVLCLL